MKRCISLITAFIFLSAGCWAQQANVNKAKSILETKEPDYSYARKLINGALQNEKTKQQAYTWYIAGLIEYEQYTNILHRSLLNPETCGEFLLQSCFYWLKADSLVSSAAMSKKDAKIRTDIRTHMMEYYLNNEFIKFAAILGDKQEYALAYDVCCIHFMIPKLDMMQDASIQSSMPQNYDYFQNKFYSALFAIKAQLHPQAIVHLEEIKQHSDYEANYIHKLLCQEYIDVNDSLHAQQILIEAVDRFPQDSWFIKMLINYYLSTYQYDEAVKYLNVVIEREPNEDEYRKILQQLKQK